MCIRDRHQAAAILLNTDKKIGDVSQELGYQNASKFAEAFQHVMGVTPLQYRNQGKSM